MIKETGLIVAMKEEAKPFIEGLSLSPVKEDNSLLMFLSMTILCL